MMFKRSIQISFSTVLKRAFGTKNESHHIRAFTQPTKKFQPPAQTPNQKEALKNQLLENLGDKKFSELNNKRNPMSTRIQDVYKGMDSSLEGFFNKREYNLKNFNFLLQVLAEQKKSNEALKAFSKMKDMGIKPTQVTYLQLLTAVSKDKNAEKAEEIFLEAKNDPKIGVSIQMYNSLILCYTRRHDPDMAHKILREIRDVGLKPDIVCYTTVINAYKNARNLKKCWEVYEEATLTDMLIPDENILGLMIEICAGSHEAEKAKRYFNDVLNRTLYQTCLPYNALIKALGSRKDYAAEAITMYNRMLVQQITPDADTYIALFKACGMIGDVKTAYNALMQLKAQNIPLSIYMYNGLLKTYGAACAIPNCSTKIKEMYVEDAWNLFRQLQTVEKLPVSVNILNSLLQVHTKALMTDKVEGLVLPLYEKYEIKKDEFTYQHLMEMYMLKRDIDTVHRLYQIEKAEGLPITFPSMNIYLEIAMRLQDNDKIVEALQDFKRFGKEPKEFLLKRLGYADNMPDRIYLELIEFEKKFGFVRDPVRRHQAKDKYLHM